jgi:hypothetical protein
MIDVDDFSRHTQLTKGGAEDDDRYSGMVLKQPKYWEDKDQKKGNRELSPCNQQCDPHCRRNSSVGKRILNFPNPPSHEYRYQHGNGDTRADDKNKIKVVGGRHEHCYHP